MSTPILFLLILSIATPLTCTFSSNYVDYIELALGFLEGLMGKLAQNQALMCINAVDSGITWVTTLISNLTACKYSVQTNCGTNVVVAGIPNLMSTLSKGIINCGGLPAGFTDLFKVFSVIFADFDAYSKRLLANALTLLGLLMNYGTSGFLCLCNYGQYQKAGIEFGEILGVIITQ